MNDFQVWTTIIGVLALGFVGLKSWVAIESVRAAIQGASRVERAERFLAEALGVKDDEEDERR